MFRYRLFNRIISLVLIMAIMAISGCATPPGGSTQGEGAVIGALIGTLIGAVVCNKKNRATCMAAGAVVGGGAGYVAGQVVAQRQQQYASTEDFYDAQIQQTVQLNQNLSMDNRNLRKSIQNDQRQINTLIAQYNRGRATKGQLEAAKSAIDRKHAANEKTLADAKKELEIQQAVLVKAEKEGQGQSRRIGQLRGKVSECNSSINTMQQQVDQYATMSDAVHL